MDISKIMKATSKKYSDIINLEHHTSKTRPKMSIENRSAQFAPFAALTGYEDMIEEDARYVDEKLEINEDLKDILDVKIIKLRKFINSKPKVRVVYFEKDLKKDGGKYKTIYEKLIKIDDYNNKLVFENHLELNISDLIEIDSEELNYF